MRYQRLGRSLMALAALICWTTPVPGFEGKFRLPCEILYRGEAPFVVTCEVTIKSIEGSVVELARTPNGKTFVIKNGRVDHNEWLLDHKRAVLVSEEPKFCCENDTVEVCF
jgi:hypothetical protein